MHLPIFKMGSDDEGEKEDNTNRASGAQKGHSRADSKKAGLEKRILFTEK